MLESTASNRESSVSIKRIKEVSFFINEPLVAKRFKNTDELISFQIGLQLSFTIEMNVVFILSSIFCHAVSNPEEILSEIKVQNIFEIADLKEYQVGPAEIVLPEQLITNLVGVSISHTRALMAKNIIGTPLQENNVGLINPYELAKHFFPQMFLSKASIEKQSPQPPF